MICAACNADLGEVGRVGRRDGCPRCGADLRSCRNCRFHDPRLSNECCEPQAERVVDKARSNFCEYFAPGEESLPVPAASSPPRDARSALERLFRGR